jgi:predicted metal-dependent hydrolase
MIPFLSRKAPATVPSLLDIDHEGEVFQVALKRSAKARRYTLRSSPTKREIVLTMPMRGSVSEARAFAHRHGGWIAERHKKFVAPIAFVPGAIIPFLGEPHQIEHRSSARGTVWRERDETGRLLLVVAGKAEFITRRLRDFLKKQAKQALEASVARFTAMLDLPSRPVSIKDTTSRWGSCSHQGRLNFSWRLILAPPAILDYLAAHEVAHLKEMNHSPRYWRVVATLYPNFETAEAWLKRHGASLHRYQ